MGMFEPLIEHSGDEPRLPRESPEPRLRGDVVAPILFVLLAVALLASGAAKGKAHARHHRNLAWLLLFA